MIENANARAPSGRCSLWFVYPGIGSNRPRGMNWRSGCRCAGVGPDRIAPTAHLVGGHRVQGRRSCHVPDGARRAGRCAVAPARLSVQPESAGPRHDDLGVLGARLRLSREQSDRSGARLPMSQLVGDCRPVGFHPHLGTGIGSRAMWLWAVALVAVNPVAVVLQRKIWPISITPPFLLLVLVGFWYRDRRWGAALWGAVVQVVGMIHVGGLFLAVGLAAFSARLRPSTSSVAVVGDRIGRRCLGTASVVARTGDHTNRTDRANQIGKPVYVQLLDSMGDRATGHQHSVQPRERLRGLSAVSAGRRAGQRT